MNPFCFPKQYYDSDYHYDQNPLPILVFLSLDETVNKNDDPKNLLLLPYHFSHLHLFLVNNNINRYPFFHFDGDTNHHHYRYYLYIKKCILFLI